jgi:ATP-dependent helicase/nuclease subunit A
MTKLRWAARPGWLQVLQQVDQDLLPPPGAGWARVLTIWQSMGAQLAAPRRAGARSYHDGDVRGPRFAAARRRPSAHRAGQWRALLGAALQVDGGRFLTPYALVRALRAGGTRRRAGGPMRTRCAC